MPFTPEQEAALIAIAERAIADARCAELVAAYEADAAVIEEQKRERHVALLADLDAVEVVKAEALGKLTPVKEG